MPGFWDTYDSLMKSGEEEKPSDKSGDVHVAFGAVLTPEGADYFEALENEVVELRAAGDDLSQRVSDLDNELFDAYSRLGAAEGKLAEIGDILDRKD